LVAGLLFVLCIAWWLYGLLLPLTFNLLHHLGGIDGQSLRDVVCLVYSNHFLGEVKHVVPQRDDDELAILRFLSDVLSGDGYVLVIQGRVDLVHAVERRRLVEMKRKDQAQRAQSFLSSRELGHVLP